MYAVVQMFQTIIIVAAVGMSLFGNQGELTQSIAFISVASIAFMMMTSVNKSNKATLIYGNPALYVIVFQVTPFLMYFFVALGITMSEYDPVYVVSVFIGKCIILIGGLVCLLGLANVLAYVGRLIGFFD